MTTRFEEMREENEDMQATLVDVRDELGTVMEQLETLLRWVNETLGD